MHEDVNRLPYIWSKADLLPCPFCGGQAIKWGDEDGTG